MKRADFWVPVVAAATLATGCAHAESLKPAEPEMQRSFNAIEQYWKGRHVLGKHTVARLVVVRSGETFSYTVGNSDPEEITADESSVANYCPNQSAVAVAEASYNQLKARFVRGGGDGSMLSWIVLGHEIGHNVQLKFGNLKAPSSKDLVGKRNFEQQADCLDGEALKKLKNIPDQDAKVFYESLDTKHSDHGTPMQRVSAFIEGRDGIYGCGVQSYVIFANGKEVAGV